MSYHNYPSNQPRPQSTSRPLPTPVYHDTLRNDPPAGLPPRRSSPVKFPLDSQPVQPDPTFGQQKFVPHWKRNLAPSTIRTNSAPPVNHNRNNASPVRSAFAALEDTRRSTPPDRTSSAARQRDTSPVRFYEPSPVKHDEGSLLFMSKGNASTTASNPLPSMRARSASPQRKPLPEAPGSSRMTPQQRPLSAFHALRSPGANLRSSTLPPVPDWSPSTPSRRMQPSPSWEPPNNHRDNHPSPSTPSRNIQPSPSWDPPRNQRADQSYVQASTRPNDGQESERFDSPQYGILDLPGTSPQFGIRDLPETNPQYGIRDLPETNPQYGIRDLPERNRVFPPANRPPSSFSTPQHSRAMSLPQPPSLPGLPTTGSSAFGRVQPSVSSNVPRSPGPPSPLSPLPQPPMTPGMTQSASQGAGSVTLRMARMGLNGSRSQPQHSAPLPQPSQSQTSQSQSNGWQSGLPPLPRAPSSQSVGSGFQSSGTSSVSTASPANREPRRSDSADMQHPAHPPSGPSSSGYHQVPRSPVATPRSRALPEVNLDDEPPSAIHRITRTQAPSNRQPMSTFHNNNFQSQMHNGRPTSSHPSLPALPTVPVASNNVPHRSNPLPPSPSVATRGPRPGGFPTPNHPNSVQHSASQPAHSFPTAPQRQEQHSSWSQTGRSHSPQRGNLPAEPSSSRQPPYTSSGFSFRNASPTRDSRQPLPSSGFRPMGADHISQGPPGNMHQRTPTPVIAAPAPQVPPIISLPDDEDEPVATPTIGITVADEDDDSSGPMISISGADDDSAGQKRSTTPKLRPEIARSNNPLTCGGCSNVISYGRTVNAMGVRWHPDCFRCCKCDTLLEHVSSYEGDGRAWCHLDYHETFAPRCYHCKTSIVEERFISLDDDALGKRAYHEHHFFCAECGDPFLDPSSSRMGALSVSGDGDFADDDVGFTVYRGHPYCEACHVRLRMPKCKKCRKSIREGMQAVEALGGKWCFECFVCKRCERPFDNPSFFERDGDPYCESCFSVMLRNDF